MEIHAVYTKNCERFEPRSHLISRLSLLVRVNVVLNRTVVGSDEEGSNVTRFLQLRFLDPTAKIF